MLRVTLIILMLLAFAGMAYAAVETRGLRVVAKDSAGRQEEVPLYNKTYAVIIGIDKYADSKIKPLKYAVRDAQGVEQVLRKQYRFDEIHTLYNEQATRERILELLTEKLPNGMSEEDSVFIFWAGHGNQEKKPDGEMGYLIPYDGAVGKLRTVLTMGEIRDNISKAIPAKHVFYIMDACYSGLLPSTRSVDNKPRRDLAYLKEITRDRVRQVLTAGGKNQEVLDGGRKGHSVFTGRLIELLEATGDFITANEIQTILKEKVFNDAKAKSHTQTPGFGTLYGNGDFVFIPNIEQKIKDNSAEIAKYEQELIAYKAAEEKAHTSRNERERREAEQQRKAAEAKLAAEKLRQQQLVDEERRRKELDQDRARFDEEQKQKERELSQARSAEERRLAELKAEVERKKKTLPTTMEATNLEAAIAEIRRLNARINDIDSTFDRELETGKKRIASRYDAEIAAVRKASQARQAPEVRGEFESEERFRARVAAQKSGFDERISDLAQKKQAELSELEQRISKEKREQAASLRASLKELSEKEYTLDPATLLLEVGRYDINKQTFPMTLRNKAQSASQQPKKGKKDKAKPQVDQGPAGVKVAMNGSIYLPVEVAEQFKTHFGKGWVRPEVTVRAGDAKVVKVAIADDAENYLLEYVGGEFMTVAERKRREALAKVAERERLFYTDQQTGLMWLKNGNIADNKMGWYDAMIWIKKLNYGGYSDWRLPTKDELAALAKRGGKRPSEWFIRNGFNNIQSHNYWSSTSSSTYGAWSISMESGVIDGGLNADLNYIWPVRGR